jgi:MarR family transcriptional repressor of emrRAB
VLVLEEQLLAVQATIDRARARGLDVPAQDAILVRTLLLVGRTLAQLVDEAIRPSGLAESEFRVLMQLFSQPDGVGNPGALCTGAGQSPANMTRITDTLVSRSLISRVPSDADRRRMILRITPEGEVLVRQIVPTAFEPVHQLFGSLTAEARGSLLELLNEIAHAADAMCATSALPQANAP